MASLRKHGKVWYFRFVDADGKKRERKGCTDRRATEELARAAESEAAKVKAGLFDPKEAAYRDHEAKPLSDHLTAWRDAMLNQGHTAKHADQSADRVRRLIAVMFGAKPDDIDGKTMSRPEQEQARATIGRLVAKGKLSDVATERVQSVLATIRDSGRSAQTCNHYRACVRAFARWAWKTGRLRDNSLIGLTGYNAKEDRRHDRRTIALDELQRLIAVAEQGPIYQAMTGPMRALCYRLAVASGLRFSEIASITPDSFDWKARKVAVAACYTKNGQTATLPLPDDLANDLAAYVAPLNPKLPIFPLPSKGVEMLRPDLEAAGIPYMDASGLFFDFHSLRCQTATLADAAGITPRVVQTMMRHSSLELTGRYTKPRAVDIENAACMLPSLKPTGDRTEVLAMTGTDGPLSHRQTSDPTAPAVLNTEESALEGQSISERLSHHFPTGGDVSTRDVSVAGVMAQSDAQTQANKKPLVSKGLDASSRLESSSVANTPDRIRTCNLRFRRPMLYPVELRVRVKRLRRTLSYRLDAPGASGRNHPGSMSRHPTDSSRQRTSFFGRAIRRPDHVHGLEVVGGSRLVLGPGEQAVDEVSLSRGITIDVDLIVRR
jgi:integrase